jgi:hypothetical protein
MAEKPNEQRKELTSEGRERRDRVRDVRKELDALQSQVLRSRSRQRKGKEVSEDDRQLEDDNALGALLDAWLIAKEKNATAQSPEWKALEKAFGADLDKGSTAKLLENLEDDLEKEEEEYAVANLAGDLSDEMRAADKYLETFPKAPPDERLWEAVQKFMDERLSPDIRSKIEGLGLDAASIRDMIVGFLAGLAEGVPALSALGGKLRFRVALEQVRNGDDAEDKQKLERLVKESVDGKPDGLKELEKSWTVLYKQWLQRKRNAKNAGTPFDEATPTIHDLWHPTVQPKAPEAQPTPLFGVPGFKRGEDQFFLNSGVYTLTDGPQKVTINTEKKNKTVQFGDGTKYVMKIGGVDINSASLRLSQDQQKNFSDIEIALNVSSKVFMRDLISALQKDPPQTIASIQGLTFEQLPS